MSVKVGGAFRKIKSGPELKDFVQLFQRELSSIFSAACPGSPCLNTSLKKVHKKYQEMNIDGGDGEGNEAVEEVEAEVETDTDVLDSKLMEEVDSGDEGDESVLAKTAKAQYSVNVYHLPPTSHDPLTLGKALKELDVFPTLIRILKTTEGGMLPYFRLDFAEQYQLEDFLALDGKGKIGEEVIKCVINK